jgi:hypothetical protein
VSYTDFCKTHLKLEIFVATPYVLQIAVITSVTMDLNATSHKRIMQIGQVLGELY